MSGVGEEPEPGAVPRIGRVLDLVGLVILLAGGALIGRARIGYGEVHAYVPSPDDPPMAAVQFADVFWRMEKVGTWLIVLGVGVFVTAWWVARRPMGSRAAVEPRRPSGDTAGDTR